MDSLNEHRYQAFYFRRTTSLPGISRGKSKRTRITEVTPRPRRLIAKEKFRWCQATVVRSGLLGVPTFFPFTLELSCGNYLVSDFWPSLTPGPAPTVVPVYFWAWCAGRGAEESVGTLSSPLFAPGPNKGGELSYLRLIFNSTERVDSNTWL